MFKFCLLVTMAFFLAIVGCYVYETVTELHRFTNIAELSAAQAAKWEEEPLHTTKHLEAMHSQVVKDKADQLRRCYNFTNHACALIREREENFARYGVLTRNVALKVEEKLGILETRNKEVKQQFEKYIECAQEIYGAECTRYNSPTAEDRALYLSEDSDKLLQSVELPISFK